MEQKELQKELLICQDFVAEERARVESLQEANLSEHLKHKRL